MKTCFWWVWMAGVTVWAGDPLEALQQGTVLLDTRLRLENVSQSARDKDADALTLRTRLGWETGAWHNWSLTAEFEDVTALDAGAYNDTANGVDRPVVADREDTELNRLHLTWRRGDQAVVLGRQRLVLGNHRFVGNVGWRQNEQTFDAVVWKGKLRGVGMTAGWVTNANRVFGEHHPNPLSADWRMNTWLVDAQTAMGRFGTLNLFAHYVAPDDLPDLAHRNLGLRMFGTTTLSEKLKLIHDLSWVSQKDVADGDPNLDNQYLALTLGPAVGIVKCTANWEQLEGNGVRGFTTPLATLHAFNGWADRFLNTPADGLDDRFLKLEVAHKGWKALGMYHRYEAERTGADLGTEWDLQVTYKHGKQELGAKYAAFEDDTADLDKFWLWYALHL